MKIRGKREVQKATRVFTDREEPRASFWKNYRDYKETMSEENIRVLAYYGIGGIGKSTLLRQLIKEMDSELKDPRHELFDFNLKQDSRSVLESLKNLLARDYKFNFPLFDLGLYNYSLKIGEDTSSPEVKGITENSPLLSFALSTIGMIPAVGFIRQLMECVDKGAAFVKTLLRKHERSIIEIENMRPDDLYRHLPRLFADDLSDNLEDAEEPLVIFLDTYEQLVNEMSSVGEPLTRDEWLRGEEGVIQNTSNVMWVIAGREKLKWERFDSEWSDALEQHILGSLSEQDSVSFLKSAGIHDERLCAELHELTQGTPVYLDLCVDRYYAVTAAGREATIDDFGGSVYALIERFLRYMDDGRKDIAYVLSCLQMWKDDVACEVCRRTLSSFSVSAYEKTKDYSFITVTDDGTCVMHQTVAAVLYENCPGVIREKALRTAIELLKEKADPENELSLEYEQSLLWMIRYAGRICQGQELVEFYEKNIEEGKDRLSVFGRRETAGLICGELLDDLKDEPDSLPYAYALGELAAYYGSTYQFEKASEAALERLEIYRSQLGEQNLDTLKAMRDYADALTAQARLEEAMEASRSAFKKTAELLGDDDPNTLDAMRCYAESLRNTGHLAEAEDLMKSLCDKSERILGERHLGTISARESYCSLLDRTGDRGDVLRLRKRIYEDYKEVLGEDHPSTISALTYYAGELYNRGKFETALELGKTAYEKYRAYYGDDDPNTLTSLNSLTVYLQALDRDAEASEVFKSLMEKSRQMLGEYNPQTLLFEMNYAMGLSGRGELIESERYMRDVYDKETTVLGENHLNTLCTLDDLANNLLRQKRDEEALTLKNLVYEKTKEVLGENDPDTLRRLIGYADCLEELERWNESLPIRRTVFEQLRALFGSHHYATTEAMKDYSNALEELETVDEETLVFFKAVLEEDIEKFGEDDGDTLKLLKTYIDLLDKAGKDEEVLPYRKTYYENSRKVWGEDSLEAEDAMRWYFKALADRGRYDDIFKCIKEVDNDVEESREEPSAWDVLYGCAAYLEAMGLWGEALPIRKSIYEKTKRLFGESDPKTMLSLKSYAKQLRFCVSAEEALPLLETVYKRLRETLGEDDEETKDSLIQCAICRRIILGRIYENNIVLYGKDAPETVEAREQFLKVSFEIENGVVAPEDVFKTEAGKRDSLCESDQN